MLIFPLKKRNGKERKKIHPQIVSNPYFPLKLKRKMKFQLIIYRKLHLYFIFRLTLKNRVRFYEQT